VAPKVSKPRMRKKAPRQTWVPLPDPAPGTGDPVYLCFTSPPDAEALEEARSHLASLEANHQIAREGTRLPKGATHAIETDAKGHRRLVRKRLSAR
jgi:hypothetical protein